jgi:hypothetical protein
VWVQDYYPEWLDNLADDATLEAPAMNGVAHGAEDIHAIVVQAQAQHIVVNHRPRNSLLLFSRLMRQKFAGTPLALHFLADEA